MQSVRIINFSAKQLVSQGWLSPVIVKLLHMEESFSSFPVLSFFNLSDNFSIILTASAQGQMFCHNSVKHHESCNKPDNDYIDQRQEHWSKLDNFVEVFIRKEDCFRLEKESVDEQQEGPCEGVEYTANSELVEGEKERSEYGNCKCIVDWGKDDDEQTTFRHYQIEKVCHFVEQAWAGSQSTDEGNWRHYHYNCVQVHDECVKSFKLVNHLIVGMEVWFLDYLSDVKVKHQFSYGRAHRQYIHEHIELLLKVCLPDSYKHILELA